MISCFSDNTNLTYFCTGIMAKASEYGIGEGLERPLQPVEDFTSESGKGVQCVLNGHKIHLGNRRSLLSNEITVTPGTFDAMENLEKLGQTAIAVSIDGRSEAVMGLIDKAKDEAALTVNVLEHALSVKVYMLTGDNFRTFSTCLVCSSTCVRICWYQIAHISSDMLNFVLR